jgi:membrane protease subunit HflC
MNNKQIFISIVGILLLMLIFASVFTVQQTEYALKLKFGKVVSADYEPGLNFKIPLVERIRYFDKRIQTLDAPPERFLTSEKKNLIVDSFVKWRIKDVVQYYISVGGSEQRAGQRLSEIIADGLRSQFGARTIQEVVSGDRSEIMVALTIEATKRTESLGIEVVDVRVKRIDLPQEVSHSVYQRMEAERERVAKEIRSRGEAEAVRIRADANRQKVILLATAERKANELRGQGDATAADIYAKAYSEDKEFFSLYRSLKAYETTFNQNGDVMVIEPDADFFKYFKSAQPKSE